jgi:hypothetical protein
LGYGGNLAGKLVQPVFPCHASRASWAYYIKTLSVNSSRSFTFGFARQVFKSSSEVFLSA